MINAGLKQSVAVCVQKGDHRSVRQEYCVEHLKPERRVKTCNNQHCPAQYVVKLIIFLKSHHVLLLTWFFWFLWFNSSKFPLVQHCKRTLQDICRWIMSAWSECSKSCGAGKQFRSVLCLRQINQHKSEVMSQKHCPNNRPSTQQACHLDNCPPRWVSTNWSSVRTNSNESYYFRKMFYFPSTRVLHPLEFFPNWKNRRVLATL